MARTAFTNRQRAENRTKDLKRAIKLALADQKVTKTEIASRLGMSQQKFSYDLENMAFSTEELFNVLMELGIVVVIKNPLEVRNEI